MDKYLLIVNCIISEEQDDEEHGQVEKNEATIKALRRRGQYGPIEPKVGRKEEPAPATWWRKNMTEEEMKKKRQKLLLN
jgi:hypothetical protein